MREGQGFEIWAGESKAVTVTVTDEDTGGSIDLTGACVTWVMQEQDVGGTTVLTKDADWTGASAITVSGCTFSFFLTHADTDSLQGMYYHEAEALDASGCTFKPLRGYGIVNTAAI